MTSTNKTAVVIVPGSFSPPSLYDAVAQGLRQHGIHTVIVTTPSVGRKDPGPPATMSDDALATATAIKEILTDGKDVVLVAHSYGGIPATQSLKYLAETDDQSKYYEGRVRRLVYLSAVVLPVGKSSNDNMTELPDYLVVEGDYLDIKPADNAKLTFSDLPYDEALTWAKRTSSHSMLSFNEPLTYAGYKAVPVAYIGCGEDRIIPVAAQERMMRLLREETGGQVDVYRLEESGHCPNASRPGELADLIWRIVEAV